MDAGLEPCVLRTWRVTAAGEIAQVGDVRRRSTLSPAMIARWIMRHASGDVAARDDAVAALERRAERGSEADGGLGGQVDVDEPRDAVRAEEARWWPWSPRSTLSWICAPVSISLNG